jgi:hypothetical protein
MTLLPAVLLVVSISCRSNPSDTPVTFDNLAGIWKHVGSNCNETGENCDVSALQDIEFIHPNLIRIGRFSMNIGLHGDTVLMGHEEARYPVIKLTENELLIKRGETGNIMKYERQTE